MSTTLIEQSRPFARTYSRPCLNHCDECRSVTYGNEQVCRRCGSEALEQLPQIGEIFSYTTVQQSGGSFVLALVELSGGHMVTARIVGLGRQLRIGLAVELSRDQMSRSRSGGLFFSPLLTEYLVGE